MGKSRLVQHQQPIDNKIPQFSRRAAITEPPPIESKNSTASVFYPATNSGGQSIGRSVSGPGGRDQTRPALQVARRGSQNDVLPRRVSRELSSHENPLVGRPHGGAPPMLNRMHSGTFFSESAFTDSMKRRRKPETWLDRLARQILGKGPPSMLGHKGSRLIHPSSIFEKVRTSVSASLLIYVALVIQVKPPLSLFSPRFQARTRERANNPLARLAADGDWIFLEAFAL